MKTTLSILKHVVGYTLESVCALWKCAVQADKDSSVACLVVQSLDKGDTCIK